MFSGGRITKVDVFLASQANATTTCIVKLAWKFKLTIN